MLCVCLLVCLLLSVVGCLCDCFVVVVGGGGGGSFVSLLTYFATCSCRFVVVFKYAGLWPSIRPQKKETYRINTYNQGCCLLNCSLLLVFGLFVWLVGCLIVPQTACALGVLTI